VRVDALPHAYNSLLMSDGYPAGALHWQISRDGAVSLGVQGPTLRNGGNYKTTTVFPPERLGQWAHLVVVYDQPAQQVTHYLDGAVLARLPLKFDVPLRLGPAEIGNWSPAGFQDSRPIRQFVGRIDELAIFARPLTDREVRDLHDQGGP
jgi:hypothetical protein